MSSIETIVTCRLKPHFASVLGRPNEHLRIRLIDVDGLLTLTIEGESGDAPLKTIILETDVGRWTVHSQCVHGIALVGGEYLVLELVECDANVPLFCEVVERVMRRWGRFSSFAQVDSGESHSESDDDSGVPLPAAMAAAEEVETLYTWDCTHCQQANQGENQVQCQECNCIRDDVGPLWECQCNRVHSVQVNSCICGVWKCTTCTLINERSSLGDCKACGCNYRESMGD